MPYQQQQQQNNKSEDPQEHLVEKDNLVPSKSGANTSAHSFWKNPIILFIIGVLLLVVLSQFIGVKKETQFHKNKKAVFEQNNVDTKSDDNKREIADYSDHDSDQDAEMQQIMDEYDSALAEIERIWDSDDDQTNTQQEEELRSLSWHTCNNMGVTVLKPEGWFTKEEKQGETLACFITKERITSNSGFTTGFSINAIPNVTQKTGLSAKEYANQLMQQYGELQREGGLTEVKPVKHIGPNGPFTGYARETAVGDNHFYYLHMANTKTDTLFIITFEGKDPTWDHDWQNYGTEIMSKVGLNANL